MIRIPSRRGMVAITVLTLLTLITGGIAASAALPAAAQGDPARPPLSPDNAAAVIEVAQLDRDGSLVVDVAWPPEQGALAVVDVQRIWLYADAARLADPAYGGDAPPAPADLPNDPGWVRQVAWSPDGAWLAAGSYDGFVRVWDMAGGGGPGGSTPGDPVLLGGDAGAVYALAWSADGTRLATGEDGGTARIWERTQIADDCGAGDPLVLSSGGWEPVVTVAWSPDGAWLAAGSEDNTVSVWNTASGELAATLVGEHGDVMGVAFNPAGDRLAVASADGQTLVVWGAAADPAQWEPLYVVPALMFGARAVAWSPDGTLLAAAGIDSVDSQNVYTVLLIDPAGGDVLAVLEGHDAPVEALSFTPDGALLASGAQDGTVRLWAAPAD